MSGLLPIPEIQYLAYLHNAEDQLRGEAASLSFFSNGQYRNPMVVRIAGLAYQKGFGGHFHNDNAVGVLRDIPGLVIASPGHPSDAAPMLRTCAAAAAVDGTVCAFLEPIALYHTRDLHEAGDGVWTAPYAAPDGWSDGARPDRRGAARPRGRRRADRDVGERAVPVAAGGAAPGRGRHLVPSVRPAVAGAAADRRGARARQRGRARAGGRRDASLGRRRRGRHRRARGGRLRGALSRVAARDTFIPLGEAANLVLVSEDEIVDATRRLCSAATADTRSREVVRPRRARPSLRLTA